MGKRDAPRHKKQFLMKENAVNEFNRQETRRLTNKLKITSKQIKGKNDNIQSRRRKMGPGKIRKKMIFIPTCKIME